MSVDSVIPSNQIIFCHLLLLLPSIFSSVRIFSNELVLLIRWLKYWSFSFNISLSKGYSRLISFRMDWLDLLTVQGNLKSLLQHHSSKALILRHSAFFIVQLSHPYMTIGQTVALIRRTFVGKVFLPRSKCLLISWLQSPFTRRRMKILTGEVRRYLLWHKSVLGRKRTRQTLDMRIQFFSTVCALNRETNAHTQKETTWKTHKSMTYTQEWREEGIKESLEVENRSKRYKSLSGDMN